MAGKSMNVFDVATITEFSSEIVEAMATDAKVKASSSTSAQGHVLRRRRYHHAGRHRACLREVRRQSSVKTGARKRLLEESKQLAATPAYRDLRQAAVAGRITGSCSAGVRDLFSSMPPSCGRADNDKTAPRLPPESEDRHFPGAGGTQRVLRIVQTADASLMKLKGDRPAGAIAPRPPKLVDAIVPQADLGSRQGRND